MNYVLFLASNLVIGLKRPVSGQPFEWDDGTQFDDNLYNNWKDGRPNFSGNCVVINGDEWEDVNCNTVATQYVCQRSAGL